MNNPENKKIKAIIFDWVGTLYSPGEGLYPSSRKVLEELKDGYKIGLVTIASGGEEARRKQIEESGVANLFDSIILCPIKTRYEFHECFRKLGVQANEAAVVGDQLGREISIGKRLGCRTYWIVGDGDLSNRASIEEYQSDFLISSIEELLTKL